MYLEEDEGETRLAEKEEEGGEVTDGGDKLDF